MIAVYSVVCLFYHIGKELVLCLGCACPHLTNKITPMIIFTGDSSKVNAYKSKRWARAWVGLIRTPSYSFRALVTSPSQQLLSCTGEEWVPAEETSVIPYICTHAVFYSKGARSSDCQHSALLVVLQAVNKLITTAGFYRNNLFY